jgi:hypothetical protein
VHTCVCSKKAKPIAFLQAHNNYRHNLPAFIATCRASSITEIFYQVITVLEIDAKLWTDAKIAALKSLTVEKLVIVPPFIPSRPALDGTFIPEIP